MSEEAVVGPLVHVGTSGWNYPEWRGKFYPADLAKTRELEYVSSKFDTLEINSSFYRLMRVSTYRKWGGEVPSNFQYAVKGWRQITHYSRLKDVRDWVAVFLDSGPLALEKKLGPLLWQLPPSLQFDAQVLETFLAELPRTMGEAREMAASAPAHGSKDNSDATSAGDTKPQAPEDQGAPTQTALVEKYPPLPPAPADQPVRHAVEPRSAGFGSAEALALFRKYNVALVQADIAGRYPTFRDVTSDLVYVRLHGSPRLYYSNYSTEVLEDWATKVKQWRSEGRDTYFYFDNTAAGWAPVNAEQIIQMVGG